MRARDAGTPRASESTAARALPVRTNTHDLPKRGSIRGSARPRNLQPLSLALPAPATIMPAAYPRLLSPLQLAGGARLANRVIMGSMHTGLEEGEGWSHRLTRMAAFFEERARGGVGLMVTGGIAPNNAGRVAPMAAMMTTPADAARHREITEAVHRHDGSKIAMQILHSGRYGYHPFNVAPSAKKAPIGWFTPKALSVRDIEQTVDDFVRCASLAEEAGYDGVEVMGSEGYLINQFIAARTNARTDEWGGSFANRTRLATTIVERVRAATRPDFILMFRLSMLDLVENGSDWQEVLALAQAIESAGASLINTGIGWHEARIPTIAASVPRGGFSWVTAKLRGSVSIPLVATNRINTPEIAEAILDSGAADLVSMARPFLADPFLLTKAAAGTPERINTCIACNQACLDHSFQARIASCLVNPKAGYETELVYDRTASAMKLAVVGAGPAGLAFSTVAAGRGHEVTLYESSDRIGGQFNLAKQVPGKEEFYETLRCACSSLSSHRAPRRRATRSYAHVCANAQIALSAQTLLTSCSTARLTSSSALAPPQRIFSHLAMTPSCSRPESPRALSRLRARITLRWSHTLTCSRAAPQSANRSRLSARAVSALMLRSSSPTTPIACLLARTPQSQTLPLQTRARPRREASPQGARRTWTCLAGPWRPRHARSSHKRGSLTNGASMAATRSVAD